MTVYGRLLNRLNAEGITYCVVMNYEQLPDSVPGHDMDLALRPGDLKRAGTLVAEAAREDGARPVRNYFRQYSHQFHILQADGSLIYIDLLPGFWWYGFSYLDIEEVLNRRESYRDFKVMSVPDSAYYVYSRGLLWGSGIKPRYHDFLSEAVRKHTDELEGIFVQNFGDSCGKWMFSQLEDSNWDLAAVRQRRCQRALLYRNLLNKFPGLLYQCYSHYTGEALFALHAPGITADFYGEVSIIEEVAGNLGQRLLEKQVVLGMDVVKEEESEFTLTRRLSNIARNLQAKRQYKFRARLFGEKRRKKIFPTNRADFVIIIADGAEGKYQVDFNGRESFTASMDHLHLELETRIKDVLYQAR